MPQCMIKSFTGKQCTRDASKQSYFLFHDAHWRLDKTVRMCQDHSNEILGTFLATENAMTAIIDRIQHKIDALKPNITYKTKPDLDEFYRKKSVMWDRKKIIRNKTCRYCDYPLNEPENNEDQISNKFSHADFHSGTGYGRAWIMFHSECAVTWILGKVVLTEKEIKYIKPQLKGQSVLQ